MGDTKIRLDKLLCDMGLGTRSQLREAVRAGRVTVDGQTVRDFAYKLYPSQVQIGMDGQRVQYQKYVYLMLNKPAGYLSATEDLRAPTVLELLPENYRKMGIFPAGRLDIDSVGLLLLTNDGAFGHAVTAPRRHVDKLYFVHVEGRLEQADADAFEAGITLEDGYVCLPGRLKILSSNDVSHAEVTIREGKFHQVKRMFLACGKKVIYLKRIAVGGLRLDPALDEGQFRLLSDAELACITAGVL